MIELDAKIPEGPIEDKWHNHLEHAKLVGPRNRPSYDVIVVGTHGRSFTAHLLLGSVAEKVVRKAPCPVLTVRPKGHQFIHPAQD